MIMLLRVAQAQLRASRRRIVRSSRKNLHDLWRVQRDGMLIELFLVVPLSSG
jgi:hypothetical protein